MPDKTYVSLKCEVKTLDARISKAKVLEALEKTIARAVNANSNFTTATKSKVTILLKATVNSLTLDDKDTPRKMTLKVSIDGVLMGASAGAFKASAEGSMDGINAKKLDQDAADLIDAVVSDLMKDKVIPQMVKMLP